MASQEMSTTASLPSIYRISSDRLYIPSYNYVPSVVQASFESTKASSIADSDSVASLTESDQGSQQSDHQSTSSWKSTKSRSNPLVTKEVRAVHNVSEQHRRKYLKSCFDGLQKEVVKETSSKVSHLVILTSALETIGAVRNQEVYQKMDHEKINLEFRTLKVKFDELIRDLVRVDPNFDVQQIMHQCGLGPVDIISPGFFEHLERSLVEEIPTNVPAERQEPDDLDSHNISNNKRPAKALPLAPAQKRTAKKAKIKAGDVSSGTSVESQDVEQEVKSEEDAVSLNGSAKNEHALFLRLIDDLEDGPLDDSVASAQRRTVQFLEPTKPLSMVERRKLAAEKGLPLHLANGIFSKVKRKVLPDAAVFIFVGVPTLPGGCYWSQSISAFPIFSSRSRLLFSRRRFSLTLPDVPKAVPSVIRSTKKSVIVAQNSTTNFIQPLPVISSESG